MYSNLYLIRGVSGAGKSNFAKELYSMDVVDAYVEADQYFIKNGEYKFDATKLHVAHQDCQDRVERYLESGLNVAVSNTSTTEKEVKVYKDLADKYKAKFVSIILENRHEGVNVHNVPPEKIKQMKERFSVKL